MSDCGVYYELTNSILMKNEKKLRVCKDIGNVVYLLNAGNTDCTALRSVLILLSILLVISCFFALKAFTAFAFAISGNLAISPATTLALTFAASMSRCGVALISSAKS